MQRKAADSQHPLWQDNPVAAREQALLAPWAMSSVESAGRRYAEPPHPYRSPFQRDRDRIIHSAAYRRLSYKTQVFTGELGDYHRTRLTHTHEVASIARTLARALRVNEDLAETLALAHDIGHPPFGHAGEDVLNECLAMVGGFSHNRQALRIVEELEHRRADQAGLNLSLEVLESQSARIKKRSTPPSPLLEAQLVDAADSIAYNTHDADDSLRLGLIDLEELLEVPLWAEAADRVRRQYTELRGDDLKRAVLHELIDWQVGEMLEQTSRNIEVGNLDSVAAVRASEVVARETAELGAMKAELEQFLFQRVYRHPRVLAVRTKVQDELRQMFEVLVGQPDRMPAHFHERAERTGVERTVGDYLSGMTDRYAHGEFVRLTGHADSDWSASTPLVE